MKRIVYLPILSVLVLLLQWYVPASMIIRHEKVYTSGSTHKMLLAPIDPNDPFRGKYIVLSFRENQARVPPDFKLNSGATAYVILKPDANGFLRVAELSEKYPESQDATVCIRGRISYLEEDGADKIAHIDYPFTRFYMEESKAADAEQRYRKAASDSNQVSYGLLNVYKGNVVVKDVIINGESLIHVNQPR